MPKPYFLSSIDSWHFNRLERILTPDLEREIAEITIEVIEENTLEEELDSEISREEIEDIVLDIREGYNNFFSKMHEDMHQILINEEEAQQFYTLSKDAMPYITRLIEYCQKFLKFPSLVQSRVTKNIDPIKKEELDSIFLQAYGTPKSFIDIYLGYQDTKFRIFEYMLKGNLLKLPALQSIEIQSELDKKVIPRVSSLVFQDLVNRS